MSRRGMLRGLRIAAPLALSALAVPFALGCRATAGEHAAQLTGGNAERGQRDIAAFGCGSCHVIPGVAGAHGTVGPPLGGIALRTYIAGVLPNTPDNMLRWLEDPPAVDSLTAMPALGLTDPTARDVAAYLYTLR